MDLGTAVFLRRYSITIPFYYRFNKLGWEYTDIGYVLGFNTYNFDGSIYFTSKCIDGFEPGISENNLKDRIKSSCPLKQIESAPFVSTNEIFVSHGILIKLGLINEFGAHVKLIQEHSKAKSKKYRTHIINRFLVVGLGVTFAFRY